VDTPEFQKLPGKPCAHLCAQGCAIHETRFPVCRAYHCGWRYLAGLPDDWRPDKSGVLVDFQSDDLPPHYPKRPGIRLTVFGPPENALKPGFLNYVARLVAADVPVILAVPGPPAFFPAGALLNDALTVTASVKHVGRARLVFDQSVVRGEERLASAELSLACVGAKSYRPVAVPEAIRKKLEGLR